MTVGLRHCHRCKSTNIVLLAGYPCLPASTHFLVGKETGLTSHVERLNNTLRQRKGGAVRRALSFSKKEYLLHLHFKLFAYHYNISVIS